MTTREKLNKDRNVSLLWVVVAGLALGVLAKLADTASIPLGDGTSENLFSDLGSSLGIFVFSVTLVAAYSKDWKTAVLHTESFLFSMLVAYFGYTYLIFGSFSHQYAISWAICAVFAGVPFSAIVALSRQDSFMASLGADLPIAVLLVEAANAFRGTSHRLIVITFNLLASVCLLYILPNSKQQRTRMMIVLLPCVAAVFLLLQFVLPLLIAHVPF